MARPAPSALVVSVNPLAPLVTRVQSGSAGQKEAAAGALRNLAINNAENRVLIAQAGG